MVLLTSISIFITTFICYDCRATKSAQPRYTTTIDPCRGALSSSVLRSMYLLGRDTSIGRILDSYRLCSSPGMNRSGIHANENREHSESL